MIDIKVIVKRYPDTVKQLTLYPIADPHYGSPQHMEKEFAQYLRHIAADENAAIVLCGDLIDNGIKTSKTDVYEETCSPREQKHHMIELLYPVRDRIICATRGNHEYRTTKETSIDVMEDMCRELGIADVYVQDMGILKVSLGRKDDGKPATYSFCVTHGSGGGQLLGSAINRPDGYQMTIEGVDGIISGHTHKPAKVPSGRLIFDPRNNVVVRSKTLIFVCTAWLYAGGYPEQKMMRQVAFHPDTILLDGTKKEWR